MTQPASISVSFDFSSGATFGYPFTIGDPTYGVLGGTKGVLAASTVPEPVVDLSPYVRQISIRRGRNIMRDTYEAGTAIIRVIDETGAWNPQNPASPYYGYLTPLRKVRVAATTATTQKFLFSGYTTEYSYHYPQGQELGYVDIFCADAYRLLHMAGIQTVTGAAAGNTTSTRIGQILDMVQFPSNMRLFDTGQTTVQADSGTLRNSLDAILNCAFTEQGAFYMNTEGVAVFKNRANVIKSAAATPIAFNQTGGIPYADLKFAFDDKLIINTATMNRAGGTSQTVVNTDSVVKYFPHGINQENLVAQTDADVLDIAKIYVATRAETTIRIDAMTVDLYDPSVPTNTMIGMDYFDNVTISNIQPDGSTLTKTLQAQGFAWDITPNSMKVTVTTLEPIVEGFVIGSSINGIIGTSLMAY